MAQVERLDLTFSLFNAHINDAGERAMRILEEFFPPWAKHIRTYKDAGKIMEILSEEGPSPATAAYLALVVMFVNGEKKEE